MAFDKQLVASEVQAAPFDYVIADNVRIVVGSVRALFTDNGAASDWLPVVEFISDSGHPVVDAADQGVKVTAGQSAQVSWFPGIKKASASSNVTSSGLSGAWTHSDPSGMSVASDNAPHYFSIHDTGGFDQFETNDPATFTNGSTTLFTGSAVYGIQINAAGTYAVLNNFHWIAQGTTGRGVTGYWSLSSGSAPSFFQFGRTSARTGDAWDTTGTVGLPHLSVFEYVSLSAGQVPGVAAPYAQIQSGGASTVSAQMFVWKMSDYVATKL